MTGARPKPHVSERLYRGLMGLYPARFRKAWGQQMLDAFRDLCRAERRRRRLLGSVRLWASAIADLVWNAFGERLAARTPSRGTSEPGRKGRGRERAGDLFQDLRQGLRGLLKQRGFTATALVLLALGIGANTAVFSLANAVLLGQLPFREPDRLVWVWSTRVDRDKAFFSIPNLMDFQAQSRTLGPLAAFANWGANLTEVGESERVQGVRITADAFELLGVSALAGRLFGPQDGGPQAGRVAVLSHGLWQRRFGGDAGLVGQSLLLNGEAHTVVGILPPGFRIPNAEIELAVPLVPESDPRRSERGSNFLRVFGRLAPGASVEQARIELDAITARLREQYPEANGKHTSPRVVPLQDEIVGGYRAALLVLLGAVGLVLLVACANLASLLLARASTRRGEIALRLVLGATRGRLIRQLVAEGVLLAGLGGALGLLLGGWSLDGLLALAPADLPLPPSVGVDARVLGFTAGVSLLCGLLLGVVPALQASRVDLGERLRGTGAAVLGQRNRAWDVLVGSEVALSLVLLIGAGLLVKSFARLQAVDPGFETSRLLLVRLSLPQAKYSSGEAVSAYFERLLPRIRSLPGVRSAGAASVLPLSGANVRYDYTVAGRPPASAADLPAAQNRWVSAGYFRAMSLRILEGREISELDRPHSPPVAVIDEELARRHWGGSSPLGKRLRIEDVEPREVEIVGVVRGVKHSGLDEPPTPTFYEPMHQASANAAGFLANNVSLVLRSEAEPMGLAAAVRREVRALDPDVPASSIRSMDQVLAATLASRRFNMLLLEVFAGAALVLAALGLYGLISYTVVQGTREIGLRMALGARGRDVLRSILGRGLRVILWGLSAGLAGAFVLTRLISGLLFGVSPTDAGTFVGMPVLFTAIGLVAGAIPARRATRVDPLVALRND